ncbi:MAG: MATE family efflux transporter [Terriglobia bacterium]
MIPLLFALGTATVTMVGANVGAGRIDRARRIAWIAPLLAAGVTEAIFAAFFPHLWIGIFSADANVLATGPFICAWLGHSTVSSALACCCIS